MAKKKPAINPFYVLLVILGVIFVITASAYGVMALWGIKGVDPLEGGGLLKFMHEHGESMMLVELALLAVATFGAMGTDQYWQNRAARKDSPDDAA